MEEKIVRDIPVDKVIPNPYQPRKVFSDSALEELSKSIKNMELFNLSQLDKKTMDMN